MAGCPLWALERSRFQYLWIPKGNRNPLLNKMAYPIEILAKQSIYHMNIRHTRTYWKLGLGENRIMRISIVQEAFSGVASGKEPACQCKRQKRRGARVLGQEDPLEEVMATYSSILAWRMPWTEEPGELLPIESHRDRHDWATWLAHVHTVWGEFT